jgi:amino acid transporter
MLAAPAAMQMRSFTGSEMYDPLGSLSVFGFLTAYALVAVALPFARRALGQHSHLVAAISVLTVFVLILICAFDLRSTADAIHARIPYIYLAYLAVGVGWYAIRRKRTIVIAD